MINNGKNFIVLDIETTGFGPDNEEIIEIAAIKVENKTMQVIDTFQYLILIKKRVPPFITNLTGITDNMVQEHGIPITTALSLLQSFVKDLNVFAHYAQFDKGFIRTNLERYSIKYTQTEWLDTIDIFKKAWPNRKNYRLEHLIIDFELATKEEHRGLSDAKHTFTLMKLADKLNDGKDS